MFELAEILDILDRMHPYILDDVLIRIGYNKAITDVMRRLVRESNRKIDAMAAAYGEVDKASWLASKQIEYNISVKAEREVK